MNEPAQLNEHHRRRLLVSCEYVDRLLMDIEAVLKAGSSRSPFPRYVQDLTSTEQAVLETQIAKIRTQLLEFLQSQHIEVRPARISSVHSILTTLGYVDIAVEELKPRYLGGYGPVPPAVAPNLEQLAGKLQASVKSAVNFLSSAAKERS